MDGLESVEIFHRPAQVWDVSELLLAFASPVHTVVTHLDLIAHHAQGIFKKQRQADWYRTTSYLALQAAQATLAISEHAKGEISRTYGIPLEEITVTPLAGHEDES